MNLNVKLFTLLILSAIATARRIPPNFPGARWGGGGRGVWHSHTIILPRQMKIANEIVCFNHPGNAQRNE